ncbi:MAG: COX15/CtaA family protein [Planctomycetota bacterium]
MTGPPARRRALYRLALLTAAATFALLCMGGLVTSLDAGLVFLDWPLSEGSLNPEGWTTDLDRAAEHGHRILGAAVGLGAVALVVCSVRWRARRPVRRLAWAVLGAVCLQGLLGGLRVTEQSAGLALLHGCLAQLVFCLTVAAVYVASGDARPAPPPAGAADARTLLAAASSAVGVVFLQIVLGAQLRHSGGPVFAHILGAVIALVAVAGTLVVALARHGQDPVLARGAAELAGIFVLQLVLGVAVYVVLWRGGGRPYTPARVAMPTLHLALGALVLARALLLALHAGRRVVRRGVRAAEAVS